MIDTGHWNYDKCFDINDWFGFIYRIVCLRTGRHYLGKKQFWSIQSKKVTGKKRKKRVVKESNWKIYTSSSTHVNLDIEEMGKDSFVFIIESLHKTKGSLYYAEVDALVKEGALVRRMDNTDTRLFYNGQIPAVKFIPPCVTDDEIKFAISPESRQYFLDYAFACILPETI